MNMRVPQPDAFSEHYWAGASRGELLFQRCSACSRPQFYPRAHCAVCLAPDPEWQVATGLGTLYSFTVVRRTPNTDWAAETPYVFALVELDEGVRITTNIVGADPDDLRCGQRVTITFQERDGTAVPVAEPQQAADERSNA
jgi:uncharacterized OB-fold protein